jgi:predicted  nucleic acid-binding Zn-ribbon protein
LESESISRDIEGLEQELSGLRAQVDEENASFSALESQIAELRDRLTQAQESVREREERLATKKSELAEAQRLERLAGFEHDLGRLRGGGGRVEAAAKTLLETLEAYDKEKLSVQYLLEEMRAAFGDDERVEKVEAALREEPEELRPTWEALLRALAGRVGAPPEGGDGTAEEDLSHELQALAQERRRTRIMEYFNKS